MKSEKERCLYCFHILFENVFVAHHGFSTFVKVPHIRIEATGYQQYCMCPRCFSKNVVVSVNDQMGFNQLRVSHIEN